MIQDRWHGVIPGSADKAPSMRSFGIVMLVGCSILAAVLVFRGQTSTSRIRPFVVGVLVGVGVATCVLSLVAPNRVRGFYRNWMKMGEAIGNVVSGVALFATFLFVVIPVGALMRMFGRDPLDRHARSVASTALHRRSTDASAERFTHLF